jgi:hypothetical protein
MTARHVFGAYLTVCLLVLVAGCAQTMSTAPARPLPPPVITTACPPLKSYTPDEQLQMAAALQALPQDNPLVQAMEDYGQLRKTVRACHG